MCNLGHAVFVEGVEQGRSEGRSKLLTAVRSIMDKLGLSLDEALNALSIPEAERGYFINAVKNGICE